MSTGDHNAIAGQCLSMDGGRGDRHLLHQPLPEMWPASMFVVAGLVSLATGLVAWERRQSSRLGCLIVAGGWAWMLAALANIQTQTAYVIGEITAMLVLGVVAHLLLRFSNQSAAEHDRAGHDPRRVFRVPGPAGADLHLRA